MISDFPIILSGPVLFRRRASHRKSGHFCILRQFLRLEKFPGFVFPVTAGIGTHSAVRNIFYTQKLQHSKVFVDSMRIIRLNHDRLIHEEVIDTCSLFSRPVLGMHGKTHQRSP